MQRPQQLPGLRFFEAATESEIRAARALEFEVFRECGYTEGGFNGEVQEYLPYSEWSVFFVAMTADGQTVGVLREIRASAAGFQTLNNFRLRGRWRSIVPAVTAKNPAIEIGTVAVKREFRGVGGSAVSMGLYREMLRDVVRNDVKFVFASLDERLFRTFTEVFRWPCHVIGYRRHYMGSVTIPVLFDADEWMRHVREKTPDL